MHQPRMEAVIRAALVSWFIVAIYFQHDVGLADNGDFIETMGWITSGPVSIEPNLPARDAEVWPRRFFHYWIPYWKLEWHPSRATTSAVLLWSPGAWLNSVLYSSRVLYLPVLSLLPKLIFLGGLVLLFRLAGRESRYQILHLVSLGVPAVLLLTTTDYVAYLNTFYRDSGSLVFLFVLLAFVLLLKQRAGILCLLGSLAAIFLMVTAKPANVYWALIATPFVIHAWSAGKNVSFRTMIIADVGLIGVLAVAAAFIIDARPLHARRANAYHSLFYGALPFSDDPIAHLRNLGMEGAAACINAPAYSPAGFACVTKYEDIFSFRSTIRVLSREPVVIVRMLKHVLDAMQDVSLDYLGRYAVDDPRSPPSPRAILWPSIETRVWTAATTPLNLWAALKFKYFPRGYVLLFVLIGFALWFIRSLRRRDLAGDLALVGLMCTIACAADMAVAIFGDGKYELIKHLFLANVLFDVAAVVFVNGVLVVGLEFSG